MMLTPEAGRIRSQLFPLVSRTMYPALRWPLSCSKRVPRGIMERPEIVNVPAPDCPKSKTAIAELEVASNVIELTPLEMGKVADKLATPGFTSPEIGVGPVIADAVNVARYFFPFVDIKEGADLTEKTPVLVAAKPLALAPETDPLPAVVTVLVFSATILPPRCSGNVTSPRRVRAAISAALRA